jgi:HAD superfamily hydrolase (TIGR01509 family)
VIEAVVFDLDGVLLDTEQVWDEVREAFVLERGGRYGPEIQRAMMGMSSPEWSSFLHTEAGVPDAPEEINADVVQRMVERYRRELPIVPGAREAVERVGERWPLGLASSSNRPLIDAALELAGLASSFRATVSSEEVARGKPAPDVYLEAARRLGAAPEHCVAVEDSHAGIRSAKAAGMRVIAIPNPHYPPDEASLAEAHLVLRTIDDLTPEVVAADHPS